jgi:hypothetical protein
MKESVLVHILVLNRKLIKEILFNLRTSLEACCHKISTNSSYFEHYFAGAPARPKYLRSAAHHYEMSL